MYQFSDSDSVDSDEGIRYKTVNIRNKKPTAEDVITEKHRHGDRTRKPRSRSRSRSRSNQHTERKLKKRKNHSPEEKTKRKHSENKHKVREISDHKKHKKKRDRSKSKESSGNDRPRKPVDTEECASLGPSLSRRKNSSNKEPSPQRDISQTEEDNVEILQFGPILPPKTTESNDKLPEMPENGNNFGPQLPPHLTRKSEEDDAIIGPILPPHFITVSSLDDESSGELDESNSECITSNNRTDPVNVIGPVVPPHIRQQLENSLDILDISQEEEGEDVYGPIPIGEQCSQAHLELEERALKIKLDQLEPADNKQPVREEWMLSLPQAKAANFGLGPRQFRAKAGPDLSDRSSWTDTPEDKAKKKEGKVQPVVDLKREAELKHIESRNREQEAISKKHKKEKDSLLEIHRKKLKKESKSESGPSERRPFSREIDLQVNRFDEAQKKAVLKKAQLLDNRFSSGEAKFL